mmetsp:Transcript_57181/g.147505  ORF Transcript_57181/g.147505 Transcript_57181/m.147505 type:complete len:267 (-) Transcript_57181:57-857(-)
MRLTAQLAKLPTQLPGQYGHGSRGRIKNNLTGPHLRDILGTGRPLGLPAGRAGRIGSSAPVLLVSPSARKAATAARPAPCATLSPTWSRRCKFASSQKNSSGSAPKPWRLRISRLIMGPSPVMSAPCVPSADAGARASVPMLPPMSSTPPLPSMLMPQRSSPRLSGIMLRSVTLTRCSMGGKNVKSPMPPTSFPSWLMVWMCPPMRRPSCTTSAVAQALSNESSKVAGSAASCAGSNPKMSNASFTVASVSALVLSWSHADAQVSA